MKKFLVSSIILLFLVSCGGGGSSSSSNNQNDQNFDSYPNEQVDDNIIHDDNDSTIIINETTELKPSNILATFEKYGYTFSTLDLQTSFRGEVDYTTYMYFTNQSNTVAILGNYVYALSNGAGQRILVTIDAPNAFDNLEKSSELILRANFIENSSSLRYTLPFAPKGYVNINTTRTDTNATVGTLLAQVANAFNQFILTNPNLTKESLSYSTDSSNTNSVVVCNNQEFDLKTTQKSLTFSNTFAQEEMVHCSTQSGVLIGSIYTPIDQPDAIIATVISGDFFKSILSSVSQVEGYLTTNKEEVGFIANSTTGQFGTFEILSDGHWIYQLNSDNLPTATESFTEQFDIESTDGVSGKVEINIQHLYDNPTNFTALTIRNVMTEALDPNQDYSQEVLESGILGGSISDADGISLVEISYSDATSSNYSNGSIDNEIAHRFNTTLTITVTDKLGNVSTDTKTIIEKNEVSNFDYLSTYHEQETNTARLDGMVKDYNAIASVTITYSDGKSNTLNGNGESHLYLYDQPSMPYGSSYTIELTDALGYKEQYSNTFMQPTYYPTEFANVQVLQQDTMHSYLSGYIKDDNGISYVSISYMDSMGNQLGSDYIQGNAQTMVDLDGSTTPYPYGTTYIIYVQDETGDYAEHTGTFGTPIL